VRAAIRESPKVARGGYKGATNTTQLLLNHWFLTDHRSPEVRLSLLPEEALERDLSLRSGKTRRQKTSSRPTHSPRTEALALRRLRTLLVKMATGSGKTKVMSLAVAWQYFNAVGNARRFRQDFLARCAHVIVFERCGPISRVRGFCNRPIIPKSCGSTGISNATWAARRACGSIARSI